MILPIPHAGRGGQRCRPSRAKLCGRCGYLHPIAQGGGPDLCERCRRPLDQPLTELLRLQNVATRRRDRITSDEEERQRQGYEVRTAVRFAEHDGRTARRTGTVEAAGEPLATLDYGHAATIWRVNFGWRRRANPEQLGFVLDTERGYWAAQRPGGSRRPGGPDVRPRPARDPVRRGPPQLPAARAQPSRSAANQMASLAGGAQARDPGGLPARGAELAAEPLPTDDVRRLLLFYEAAEGGAGVLRRLLDDPAKLAEVAREALAICHFDPDTGEDLDHAPGVDARTARPPATTACSATATSATTGCSTATRSRTLLLALAAATVERRATGASAADEHLDTLLRPRCDSDLERRFLDLLVDAAPPAPERRPEADRDRPLPPRLPLPRAAGRRLHRRPASTTSPTSSARTREATARLEDAGYR